MTHQLFPNTEPLEIAGGRTGPLSEFFVPLGAEQMFLRVVALWRDNTALVGQAPTFQFKSGPDAGLTTVEADGATVEVRGGKDDVVAIASCQRTVADTYLVSLLNLAEDAGPWQMRIRNNESETLRFAWVSSRWEENTLQPWMMLDHVSDSDGNPLPLVAGEDEVFVTVRNCGTAPLILSDEPGVRLGASSPVALVSRPAQVPIHGVDRIAIRCGEVPFRGEHEHVFDTNDRVLAHNTLRFQTFPVHGGPGYLAPEPGLFCRSCARCPQYLPPSQTTAGRCRREGCGHPAALHFPVPPEQRNR